LQNTFHIYHNESMALSHASFFAMNTYMELVLCDLKKTEAEFTFSQIYEETHRIEKMLNRFDPQSEVSKVNSNRSENIVISKEFYTILEQCLEFNRLTSYFFDVCINTDNPVAPGSRSFLEDAKKCTIQPVNTALNFDFGAYAKGYVLDRIKVILEKVSLSNALVNFGNSSIMALGHHPHGDCWKISLQHSFNPAIAVYTFDLLDEVLTTSGILPTKNAHIRSPFTGELHTEKTTYSAITKTAVEGEAISTALYAANDIEQQKTILKNFGVRRALKVAYEDEKFTLQEIMPDY
jgi:FAD:protein FMN transferase